MVKGLDTFRKYFEGYESQYVLIGGETVCRMMRKAFSDTFLFI